MAIKTKKGYKCGYCGKIYPSMSEADVCKEGHNLIYVAFSKEDLNRLVNFIYSKDDRLLSEKLVSRLQSYMRGVFELDATSNKDERVI